MVWYRTLHSIIVVIFVPYNPFPIGEMEIFCLGEYGLFDLFNMDCRVWKWHDKEVECATVLWRNWSLAVNSLEDIAKSC